MFSKGVPRQQAIIYHNENQQHGIPCQTGKKKKIVVNDDFMFENDDNNVRKTTGKGY